MTINSAAELPTQGPVWLLIIAVAVVGSNSLLMGPIAPGISADLGASVQRVLWASAGFGLGTGAGALLLARWIDRCGFVLVLRLAFLTLILAFGMSAMAGSVTLLIVAQSLAGLAAGVALPAVYAFAAHIAPQGRESLILGRVLTGWTISLVLGVSLSAMLADVFHWRYVYLLLSLPACLVFFNMMRQQRDPGSQAVAISPVNALRINGVPALLAQVSLYMIAFYGTYSLVGDHIVTALEFSLSANALLAASYGVGFGVAAFFDNIIDRFGAARATPWFLAGLATVYGVLALVAGNYVWLLAIAFLWGLFNHLGVNGLIAQLSAIDPEQRGTILGLYSGCTYLCMCFATLVFAWLYTGLGWPPLSALAALLCLLGAGLAQRRFSLGS